MLLQLLSFFEDNAANTGSKMPEWVIYVVGGVLIVGMILLMVLPQRKQKKRQEQMMSTLAIGSIVTTIGGIVGEVVEMDDKHIWLLTGTGDNRATVLPKLKQRKRLKRKKPTKLTKLNNLY